MDTIEYPSWAPRMWAERRIWLTVTIIALAVLADAAQIIQFVQTL